MNSWIEAVVIFVVLVTMGILGTSRLSVCIRLAAVQGAALSGLTLLLHHDHITRDVIVLSAGGALVKGILFPFLLARALRDARVRIEVEPFVSHALSLFAGVLALGVSFWLGSRLPAPGRVLSPLLVPLAFFTIIAGLFLIVSRRNALTQVLGYLVLENGVFAFGVAFVQEQPILVEFGVLLDVFVAVFVMGIMIFKISREFDHIDADQLVALRDWEEEKEEVKK